MEDSVRCCKMIITRSLYIGVGSDQLIMVTFEDSQPLAFHIYIINNSNFSCSLVNLDLYIYLRVYNHTKGLQTIVKVSLTNTPPQDFWTSFQISLWASRICPLKALWWKCHHLHQSQLAWLHGYFEFSDKMIFDFNVLCIAMKDRFFLRNCYCRITITMHNSNSSLSFTAI